MFNQIFSEFLDKDKKYLKMLPKLLGIIGGLLVLPFFLLEIYISSVVSSGYSLKFDTSDELIGTFIFFILPVLLGVIGGIKSGTRPFISGILMFIGGLIFFIDWALDGPSIFFISAFMLMVGGLLAIKKLLWIKLGLIILFLLFLSGLMILLAT